MTITANANQIYSRLRAAGIDKPYLKRFVLPDWWDDSVAETKMGFQELALRIARAFSIDVGVLLDPEGAIQLSSARCLFKSNVGANKDGFATAVSLSMHAAVLAAQACNADYVKVEGINPEEIRNSILCSGASCVGLAELTRWCWQHGIPVLHLPEFPTAANKPDGMLLRANGRPVIVICKNAKFPAWLLFILAHELGHLIAGHLESFDAVVDDSVSEAFAFSEHSVEEQANRNAIAILTGDPSLRFSMTGRWPSAAQLAQLAIQTGHKKSIDPGHVVLNYSHVMGREHIAVANAALKQIEGHRNGPQILRNILAENLQWQLIPEESAEFLSRVTKIDSSTR